MKLNIISKNLAIKSKVDQSWTIEKIAKECPPPSWENTFKEAEHDLASVSDILVDQEKKYGEFYPKKADIFNAFFYTTLSSVKVVIVGQDPYSSLGKAMGLSFSVKDGQPIPVSLQNIYTELANTVHGFVKPDSGNLTEWAYQGVLLLNMCLTVRPGQSGSHGDIWLGFISKVLKSIAAVNPYCIFLLWGKEAQKIKPMIGERSIIFEAAHPSGFSARKGFFGCNHFNLVKDALLKQGKTNINWKISSPSERNSYTNPTVRPIKLIPVSTLSNYAPASSVNTVVLDTKVDLPEIPKPNTLNTPEIFKPTDNGNIPDIPIIHFSNINLPNINSVVK